MVSGPFNWYTVGLLMATERCLNARAHLDIVARFRHSLQSCTPKGMMGT